MFNWFMKDLKDITSNPEKIIKINITNGEYCCRVLGNGGKNVIAFHGFGQDGSAFLPVAIKNPSFTIYSFDLPFSWRDHNPQSFSLSWASGGNRNSAEVDCFYGN